MSDYNVFQHGQSTPASSTDWVKQTMLDEPVMHILPLTELSEHDLSGACFCHPDGSQKDDRPGVRIKRVWLHKNKLGKTADEEMGLT